MIDQSRNRAGSSTGSPVRLKITLAWTAVAGDAPAFDQKADIAPIEDGTVRVSISTGVVACERGELVPAVAALLDRRDELFGGAGKPAAGCQPSACFHASGPISLGPEDVRSAAENAAPAMLLLLGDPSGVPLRLSLDRGGIRLETHAQLERRNAAPIAALAAALLGGRAVDEPAQSGVTFAQLVVPDEEDPGACTVPQCRESGPAVLCYGRRTCLWCQGASGEPVCLTADQAVSGIYLAARALVEPWIEPAVATTLRDMVIGEQPAPGDGAPPPQPPAGDPPPPVGDKPPDGAPLAPEPPRPEPPEPEPPQPEPPSVEGPQPEPPDTDCPQDVVAAENAKCADYLLDQEPVFEDFVDEGKDLGQRAKQHNDRVKAAEDERRRLINIVVANYYDALADYQYDLAAYKSSIAFITVVTEAIRDRYDALLTRYNDLVDWAGRIEANFDSWVLEDIRLENDKIAFERDEKDYAKRLKKWVAELKKFLKKLKCTQCPLVRKLAYDAELLKKHWPVKDPDYGSPPDLDRPDEPPAPGARDPQPADLSLGFSGVDWKNPVQQVAVLQVFRATAEVQNPDPANMPPSIIATLANGNHGRVTIELVQTFDDHLRYASDAIIAALPGADPNDGFIEVAACPGDTLTLKSDTKTAQLSVTAPDDFFQMDACVTPPDIPEIHLEEGPDSARVVDPQSLPPGQPPPDRPLRVTLTEKDGTPIPHEPILWTLRDRNLAVVTLTDEDGEARLDFAIADRGLFVVVADGLPLPETEIDGQKQDLRLTDGEYTFDVLPADPTLAVLMDTEPLQLTVDLVRPTTIGFTDMSGLPLKEIYNKQSFRVVVQLGRKAKKNPPAEISIALKTSYPDDMTVTATPTLATLGIYSTTVKIRVWDTFAVHIDNKMRGADGGAVRATALGSAVVVPFYVTGLRKAQDEAAVLLRALAAAFAAKAQDPKASSEEKAEYALNAKIGANGIRWLTEPHPSGYFQVSVSMAYVRLLTADRSHGPEIDLPVAAAAGHLPNSLKQTTIRFVSQDEATAVMAALASAHTFVVNAMWQIPGSVATNVQETVAALRRLTWQDIGDALVSPLVNGYLAVTTGNTASGEAATLFEKIFGVVDALIFLATLPSAIKDITMIGKAAAVVVARVAITGFATARMAFGLLLNSARSLLIAPDAMLAEAAQAAVRVDRTALKFVDRADRAAVAIEAHLVDADRTTRQISSVQSDIQNVRGQLPAAPADQAGVLRNQLTKSLATERALTERLDVLQRKIDFRQRIGSRTNRALTQRPRVSLSPDRVRELISQNGMPGAFERIRGRLVHRLYEEQIAELLRTRGFNSGAGNGVKLHTAYRTPNYTYSGRRPRYFGQTAAPRMDHINFSAIDIADSKYYLFDGSTPTAKSAQEISDTLEKGRLVQNELLHGSKVPLNEQLAFELFNRKLTIFTPVAVPPDVLAEIRKILGARNIRMVTFEVVPPDLASWIAGAP